jgi:hypothetical protein
VFSSVLQQENLMKLKSEIKKQQGNYHGQRPILQYIYAPHVIFLSKVPCSASVESKIQIWFAVGSIAFVHLSMGPNL